MNREKLQKLFRETAKSSTTFDEFEAMQKYFCALCQSCQSKRA